MKNLLEKAGASFLRAFGASILVLSIGVLSAPNLDQAYALGVAALIASVTAGLKALQVLVPSLSLVGLFEGSKYIYLASWADSFVRAFLGALIVGVIGVLNAPDFATAKALAVAAIVGAFAAALRAVQGIVSADEAPAVGKGL